MGGSVLFHDEAWMSGCLSLCDSSSCWCSMTRSINSLGFAKWVQKFLCYLMISMIWHRDTSPLLLFGYPVMREDEFSILFPYLPIFVDFIFYKLPKMTNKVFFYHYKLIYWNMFDMFHSISAVFIETQPHFWAVRFMNDLSELGLIRESDL